MNSPAPKPLTILPTPRQLSLIRFSLTGDVLLAAGRDAKIYRWDWRPNEDVPADALKPSRKEQAGPPSFPELPPLPGHNGWVTHLAFSPQRPEFYSADSWGRLIAWSMDGLSVTPHWSLSTAHDGWIRQIALNSDGERLVTVGKDRALRLWSTADGKLLRDFANQPDDLCAVMFSPDDAYLVSGDLRGIVRQVDAKTGTLVREFDAKIMYLLSWIQDVGGVRVLRFDAAGKTLAVAGAQPTSGGFVQAIPLVKFFDWADGRELQTLRLGDNTQGYVQDLAWHPEGYWLGVCSGQPGQGNFFLHRVGEEKPFFQQPLPNCHSLAVSPDGKRLAVISNSGTHGQMRSKAREGNYPGNTSPVHVFEL